MRPPAMMMARLHTASTSSKRCVEMTIALCGLNSRMMPRISYFWFGSSPSLGSSRIRTDGSCSRACAVGPEKTPHLAFRNREGHAVDRRQRAEFFDEMTDLQHPSLRRGGPFTSGPLPTDDGGGTATEPRMPQRRPGKALPGGKHHCKQPIVPEMGRR